MIFMRWTLLIGAIVLGALALGTPQGLVACGSAGSGNPPVAATTRASAAAHADAPVKAVVEDEPAAGLGVRTAAQARRALALAILLGGNADHD